MVAPPQCIFGLRWKGALRRPKKRWVLRCLGQHNVIWDPQVLWWFGLSIWDRVIMGDSDRYHGITLVAWATYGSHTFSQMVCWHRAVPDKKLISGSDVWHVLRKQLCHLISFWAWVLLLMQQESWNELLVVLSDRFCTHWQSLVLTCTLICEDKTAWPLGCCHFQHSSDRSWKIGLWKKTHPFFRCPGSRPTVATALSKMATPRCLEHLNSRYSF